MNNDTQELIFEAIGHIRKCAETLELGDEILIRENNPLSRCDIGMQQSLAYDVLKIELDKLISILSHAGVITTE